MESSAPIQSAVLAAADALQRRLEANARDLPPEPEAPAPLPWADELERGGFTRAGAPEDFERVCRAAADLEAGEIRALILTGCAGCGKTLAASIVARRAFPARNIARGWRPQSQDWRARYRPRIVHGYEVPRMEEDEAAAFRACRCGDIVLDDMGTEHPVQVYGTPTDLVAEYLASFCDGTGFGDTACIVTTNLSADELRNRYGERILSRLVETFAWLPFKSGDKRAKKARVY